jgi:hypothetical protein
MVTHMSKVMHGPGDLTYTTPIEYGPSESRNRV